MNNTNSILITGATSGIGRAYAKIAPLSYTHLYITGRRADRLDVLKTEIENEHPNCTVNCLVFDVREYTACKNAIAGIPSLDALVNNAGLALGKNPFQEAKLVHWEQMLDTNVKGILYITQLCYPLLKASNNPHIVNISSIAGKETYPNGNVYCASKHAVDSLSKAMRQDFLKDKIRVSNICPGAVETEFSVVRHEGDTAIADATYHGFTPLKPEDVAESIAFCLSTPKHVNINDLVIMPTAQANATQLYRNEK